MRYRRSAAGPLAGWMLVAAMAAASEDGVAVRGQVVDAATGTPLVGAQVKAGDRRVETGALGEFTLELGSGLTSLEVRADGYAPSRQELSLSAAEAPPPLRIALLPGKGFHERTDVV